MSDVLDLLHPSLVDSAECLRKQFAAARPFRHVVIGQFLAPFFCERLMADFPVFSEANARNEFGEAGGKAVVPELRSISFAYTEFDRLMRSKSFRAWLGACTSIPGLLYDPDYAGGGTHENLDGQELDWHVDFNYHPRRALHRRLNLIVFLNREWQRDWGGCLEFHPNPWERETRPESTPILPLANSCVIFETTESSWHGFKRIRLPQDGQFRSRRSIAVYFYSKTRPLAETAPSHGTVYVPRALPGWIMPGYTLRTDDVAELEILFARRDRQIRFLYDRELDVSRILTGICRSPSFRLGRSLTWPLRVMLRKSQ